MLKFDHCYLVAKDLQKLVDFYTALFEQSPTKTDSVGWADWSSESGIPYFGLMSELEWQKSGQTVQNSGNPIIALRTDDLSQSLKLIERVGGKIITQTTKVANLDYEYYFLEFQDPEGNRIEVANYNHN